MPVALAQPTVFYDIAQKPTSKSPLTRVYGSQGQGSFGVPLTGPGDMDGDGLSDYAVAFMRASPLGRVQAGEVDLVFGTGRLGESIDTSQDQPRLVRFAGEDRSEAAGNEIWSGDFDGDGLADLLIGRQNHTPGERIGAGALSIVFGTPQLRQFATSLDYFDLANPPAGINVLTILGRATGDRFGIWMRSGDVDGDGIDDIVVAADQEDLSGPNSGTGYLIRGGTHLKTTAIVDLNDVSGTPLEGQLARILPPPQSGNFHLGATNFLADLDGNGRAEVFLAAALNRAGAALQPFGANSSVATGGAPRGRLFIVWDDNFPQAPWPANFELQLNDLPGNQTAISGGVRNFIFGEEIIAGYDFDGDHHPDLFVGDFQADETGFNFSFSGAGYVLYQAQLMKGMNFSISSPPQGVTVSTIAGPSSFAIGADTATAADFDGDGFDDLAFGSPKHDPQGRMSAGTIHVFFGQAGGWPAFMSTVPGQLPSPSQVRITEIQGALGTTRNEQGAVLFVGDTLCYSAASGDVDGDGYADLFTNEMLGNGLAPNTEDVGNLIIISGPDIARQSMLDFAQFGNGEGFFSRLQLSNPNPHLEITATARFQDDAGNPLPVPLIVEDLSPADAELRSEVELTVPPLGTVSIRTDGSGAQLAGTARVSSNGTLGGLIFFNFPGIGLAGIPASRGLSNFLTPVRRSGSDAIQTGIAVSNLGATEAVLEATLNNADGQLVSTADPIPLAPGGHLARFFNELFGDVVEVEFVGNLVVKCDGCSLAAVALELGSTPGNFTAVPVIELPTP